MIQTGRIQICASKTQKGFEPDKVCDEGGDLRKTNLMAKYYNELQGNEM